MPHDLAFASKTGRCAGWHFPASNLAFANADGDRPCVVMAHGFGGTRDSGLAGFAERFAEVGLDVLAFDYRGFADSDADTPRLVRPAAQREDYHAAIACARTLDGVDGDRIVAWGVSLAGGHVLRVGAEDGRLAAVVALTPAPDGVASMVNLAKSSRPRSLAAVTAAGIADVSRAALRRPPRTLPITGAPGETALLTAPGTHEAFARVAGPTWVNETPARIALLAALDRPGRHAANVRCPVLVQIADYDRTAPPAAARRAAWDARADVRSYPCDHFDVYPGEAWFEPVVEHQLLFLRRQLAVAA